MTISLDTINLPYYVSLSVIRMFIAYVFSLVFCLIVGYIASNFKLAGKIILPILDIIQSAPILSFVPVFLVSLSFLPSGLLIESTAIFLICTNMVSNLNFAWYQALETIPARLSDATKVFGMNRLTRLKNLELPFASQGLTWNTILSWTGGWYYLQLSEAFTANNKLTEVQGLGSYIYEAANQGNVEAMAFGILSLILVVIIIDRVIWKTVLVWVDKFKVESVTDEGRPTSTVYDLIVKYGIANKVNDIINPIIEKINKFVINKLPAFPKKSIVKDNRPIKNVITFVGLVIGVYLLWLILTIIINDTESLTKILLNTPISEWEYLLTGLSATFVRVIVTVIVSIAITVPLGIYICSSKSRISKSQILMQIGSSIPATSILPVIVIVLIGTIGLQASTIILMMTGSTWYLLYNVVAGLQVIPNDLKDLSTVLQLNKWTKLTKITIPALLPFLVTGAITSAGGAWSTSIVSEYLTYGSKTIQTIGIGSIIAASQESGDNNLLLLSTLVLIVAVVIINVIFWQPLYNRVDMMYHID